MTQRLAFQVHPSDPMVVTVTAADGRQYRMALRLAILGVTATHELPPDDPGTPKFSFEAQLVVDPDPRPQGETP